MLIMVYKANEEKEAKAEIVKYSDRVWFDSTGDAKCLRSAIIHILGDSPKPLSQLSFLIPVPRDHILEILDRSETCLAVDFPFNHFKTGGYKIKTKTESGGTIFNDGFDDVTVRHGNTVDIIGIDNTSVVTLKFAQEIRRGEFREVRFLLSISSLATIIREDTYAIDLPYFGEFTSLSTYRAATDQVRAHEQIPVIPIYNKDTRQGGFDVILYLPPGVTGHDFPALATKSIDRYNEEGVESEGREKYIWRLRQATDAPEVNLGVRFSIAGNWSFEIRPKIREMGRMVTFLLMAFEDIRKSASKSFWISIAALVVGIVALIISLVLR